MASPLQLLRHGLRGARRSPGFTAVAVVTLALGIGVNSAVFGLVQRAILGEVPVEDPDRVVILWATRPEAGEDTLPASMADFLSWREEAGALSGLAAMTATGFNLTGQREPRRVQALAVTAGLFEAWGIRPFRGRGFRPGDDLPGAPPVALLGHGFWRRELGGADLVGRPIQLDRREHTVVGILPPEVEYGDFAALDLWVPLTLDAAAARDDRSLALVTGRLAPGVTLEAARREMAVVAARLAAAYPATNRGWSVRVSPLAENLVGGNTRAIVVLLVLMVGFVLLIACSNVAGMVLARDAGRRREVATRLALGASRRGLLASLLAEGALLAVAGAAAGLLLAHGLLVLLAKVAGRQVELLRSARLDLETLLFTLALAALTPLVFGLFPALKASRTELQGTLREAGGGEGGRRGLRVRRLLVAGQLALASVLLVVCGLLARTLFGQLRQDLGFEHRDRLTLALELPASDGAGALRRFHADLLARVEALPEVAAAAVAGELPLGPAPRAPLEIEGRPAVERSALPQALRFAITPGYLELLEIPLVRGRPFGPDDRDGAPPVALVSAGAAAALWPGQDPMGARIRFPGEGPEAAWREVVGIVGDVGRVDRAERGAPQVYLPFDQAPGHRMVLVARSAAAATALPGRLRAEVRALDPELPVDPPRTLTELRRDAFAGLRAIVLLFAVLAGFALAMAAVGLYGLVSYAVARQQREIGLRMALGAAAGEVVGAVLRPGLALTAIGLAAGSIGAALAAGLLRGVVFGISPWDPLTFAAAPALLAAVAVLAHLAPIRRALRVDPARLLRSV